jgi:hypothetical protein
MMSEGYTEKTWIDIYSYKARVRGSEEDLFMLCRYVIQGILQDRKSEYGNVIWGRIRGETITNEGNHEVMEITQWSTQGVSLDIQSKFNTPRRCQCLWVLTAKERN